MMRLAFKTIITRGIALSVISLTLSMPSLAQQLSPFDLDTFRWKHRLLLVFAPTPNDTAYQDLKQQIQRQQQDFDERDMLLIEVLAQGSSRVGADALSPAAAIGLREQFGISTTQFDVLLIGKDGGVKLRTGQPSTLAKIFALIDTMPMRKREMQQPRQL